MEVCCIYILIGNVQNAILHYNMFGKYKSLAHCDYNHRV